MGNARKRNAKTFINSLITNALSLTGRHGRNHALKRIISTSEVLAGGFHPISLNETPSASHPRLLETLTQPTMKFLSLLLGAALLAVAIPVPSARAEVDVSIDFFFDALSPQGDWIYAQDYGYVWQPTVAQRSDWAPYSDGYWAYTDAGWTWISNEDFGWATYHYGRWIRMQGNWVWVPGYEWAPAWVSWRQTDDHVGWAPLPPEATWSVSVGFNQWSDSYYDVGPSYYNFVPFNLFAQRSSLRPYIVDRSRNVSYISRSTNVTNISYRQNVMNNIFVGGPDPSRFDRGDNRIRRLTLRRDEDSFRRDWIDNRGDRSRPLDSLSRIERDELVIASPRVRRDEAPGLPSRVRERFDRTDIDRGWRGVADSKAAENLRERQRAEFAKAKPDKQPVRKLLLATSKTPPPAVGRLLKPEERRTPGKKPISTRIDEEVRKATPKGKPDADRPRIQDSPPEVTRRPGMTEREERPNMRPDSPPQTRRFDERPNDNDRRSGMPEKPDSKTSPKKPTPSPKSKAQDSENREAPPSKMRRPEQSDSPPSPAKVKPQPRPQEPKMRPPGKPQERPVIENKPSPQVKQSPPKPRPQIKQASPKERPKPEVKKAPPQTASKPALQRKAPEKKKSEDTRRD